MLRASEARSYNIEDTTKEIFYKKDLTRNGYELIFSKNYYKES